jgi:hypothetical protein
MAEEREDDCGNSGLYNEWQEAGKSVRDRRRVARRQYNGR